VIPEIQQSICSSSRRKTVNDILLHLDNAPARNSRLSLEKIESAKAKRAAHLSCSRVPAPSGFFLGFLKEKFHATLFTTSDDLLSAI
jgi:hypothetical protein